MDLVFLIPIAFFATIALIVKWSLEYSRWKREYARGGSTSGNSLGTHELKALIREAVEEANEPLLDRVEALETHLETLAQPRLTTAHASLLDEPPDAYEAIEAEAVPAAHRNRVS